MVIVGCIGVGVGVAFGAFGETGRWRWGGWIRHWKSLCEGNWSD